MNTSRTHRSEKSEANAPSSLYMPRLLLAPIPYFPLSPRVVTQGPPRTFRLKVTFS
jgi:hypothetical protein